MLSPNYISLEKELKSIIDPKRVITNPLLCLAYGTDASFYRLIPKIVVKVNDEKEAVQVIRLTTSRNIPITYRSAGTSLSGQAVTDSVLMVATHNWKKYEIIDQAEKIKLQPGIVGARANLILKPYGKQIGPDPASINSAMIGGIAANNASGMCCGVSQNSYNTVADIRLIFYDGSILDTGDSDSRDAFAKRHPGMIEQIIQLRDEIAKDESLTRRIKQKFKIKNTTGYSINAFVDYHDPFDIIKHIIIGSEGTLAFISDITYKTVVNNKYKACTMLIFETIDEAARAIPLLKESSVAAVELLDRNSIRSVEDEPEAPDYFKNLPEFACALLVEVQSNDEEEMKIKQSGIKEVVSSIPILHTWEFVSYGTARYVFNWKARKGLLPSIGSMRRTGTTCLIEDVAFPIEHLSEACKALIELFKKYRYDDAVLFGHALEGNLHLVFSQGFDNEFEIKRYADMIDELTDIVVNRFDGSLKAEHGTGRNMAPFVEKEWGEAAYLIMKRIKSIFDPHNLINPGVILNDNPNVHMENLKPLPETNEIVDKCIECGYCEANCVAEGLTLSPRQRIVVGREISRLKLAKDDTVRLGQFVKGQQYYLDETCATDGLCAIACPVQIDTGKYVKSIRHDAIARGSDNVAQAIANNMGAVTAVGRQSLNIIEVVRSILGDNLMKGIANGMRRISGNRIPQWSHSMPRGSKKIETKVSDRGNDLKVVYFPSCINRTMGKSKDYAKGDVELTRKTEELLVRAGYDIIYPDNLNELCCGMAFSSKGYKKQGLQRSKELYNALIIASERGRYPVLFDMSPCFFTYVSDHKNDCEIKVYDPVEFMIDCVMPKLKIKNKRSSIALFPVCSVKKIGMEGKLLELAKMCADSVTLVESNCCGFAGDRGFTYPELNHHGLRDLKQQIPVECTGGFSTSRTCEIGMTEHSDLSFKSIFYLIDEVTR